MAAISLKWPAKYIWCPDRTYCPQEPVFLVTKIMLINQHSSQSDTQLREPYLNFTSIHFNIPSPSFPLSILDIYIYIDIISNMFDTKISIRYPPAFWPILRAFFGGRIRFPFPPPELNPLRAPMQCATKGAQGPFHARTWETTVSNNCCNDSKYSKVQPQGCPMMGYNIHIYI